MGDPHKWPSNLWTLELVLLLTGKSQTAYANMDPGKANNYKLKLKPPLSKDTTWMTKPTNNASEAPDRKPKKVSPKLRFAQTRTQRLLAFKMADWIRPWRNLVTWTQYFWIIWHVRNFMQEEIATHYPSIPFFWVQPGQECCVVLLNLSNWMP